MVKRLTDARLRAGINAVQIVRGDLPQILASGSEEQKTQSRLFVQLFGEIWKDKTLDERIEVLTDLGASDPESYRQALANSTGGVMVRWLDP